MSNDIEVKIENNIFKYLSENLNKTIEEIKSLYFIEIKKTAAGVNNKNYIVQIYNKSNNSLANTVFYIILLYFNKLTKWNEMFLSILR